MTPNLHTLLRQQTAGLHRRLDGAPELLALMRPGLTPSAYAAALRRYAAAHARVEPVLQALAPAGRPGLPPYRPRLPALQADLAALQVSPAVTPEPIGPAPALGPGACLGIRYVLEGSTQGARVIAARLARHLPQGCEQAFAFWRFQEIAAAAWPALCACLDRPPRDELEQAGIVQGARFAFDTFIDVFFAAEPPS